MIVASRMPVVIASLANGYFRPGLSALPRAEAGYGGYGYPGTFIIAGW